jgi:hypothetical protein
MHTAGAESAVQPQLLDHVAGKRQGRIIMEKSTERSCVEGINGIVERK